MLSAIKNKISDSAKTYWKEILALLMVILAVFFFRNERKELQEIIPNIERANVWWLAAGAALTTIYIFFQAGIYKMSFRAIGVNISWASSNVLFLKRNFISVFLPAGGVSSLAYTPSQIRKEGLTQTQIHQASALFGFIGLLTVAIVGFPVIILSLFHHQGGTRDVWISMIVLLIFLPLLYFIAKSFKEKGKIYLWVEQKFPSVIPSVNELFAANVDNKKLMGAILYSVGVEFCGIFHLYIAMLALGIHTSFVASASAYIISVLLMIVSPFLRGLGAVELSMLYVLGRFGYSVEQALAATILYRIFEFWLPLVAGLFTYLWKGKQLFLRMAPALLTFVLGIINIISVITPPQRWRVRLLKEFLPLDAIHASNLLVLYIGLALLVTSAFLFRGLRNAWIIALTLASFSLIGHVTKALDYEEASLAAVTILLLIATASQYRIRSSAKWTQIGLMTVFTVALAVMLFGFVSFYYIDQKHFGIDFTWKQSVLHSLKIFLLVDDDTLHPLTRFGREFIVFIRILGFITWGFLLYALIRPYVKHNTSAVPVKKDIETLLQQYGNSAADYFKMYRDKLFFLSDKHDAFIAYRIAGVFAIVLEEPVCADEHKVEVLIEFEQECRKMGLKPAFYRVDENSIPWFNQLKKRKLMIGQEAILDVTKFTLEGKDKKSLRNGLNSLQKKGFVTEIYKAPHDIAFVNQLRTVSDEWLENYHKQEMIFSQGMFDESEIQKQDIIALADEEGNIKAFLNIIPDYAEDECTYDLIRKTADAPGAAMDALIIKLVELAKSQNKLYLNLGMVPMTGIQQPENTAEQIMKMASLRIKRFQQYQGLREFKEKYASWWQNKYLVYNHDFDLLQLPAALNTVMKP